MKNIQKYVKSSLSRSVAFSSIIGVSFYYSIELLGGLISPIISSAFHTFFSLTEGNQEIIVLLGVIFQSAVVTLSGAVIFLFILNYVFKPKTMLYSNIVAITYALVSSLFMYSYYDNYSDSVTSFTNLLAITSLITSIFVWLGCSRLVVKRNLSETSPIVDNS